MNVSPATLTKIMVAACAAFLLFIIYMGNANAASFSIDPDTKSTGTITCVDPISREDGTPLAIDEIATRRWYVGTSPGNYTDTAADTSTCSVVIDYSAIPDGMYYYVATVIDTDGRESMYSEEIDVTVKRVAKPNPPTGLSFN